MRLRPPVPAWTDGPTFRTAMWWPRKTSVPGARSAWLESVDLLFDEMDEAGISLGVAMGRPASGGDLGGVSNSAIVEVVESWPDRFVGFLGVDLEQIDTSLAEVRDLAAHDGIKGISIEPGSAKVPRASDDDSLIPIYETCISLGLPVSISLSGLLSALAGHDITWSNPVPIQRVAMRYPDLKIVVSHAAWPYAEEMVVIAMICDNIYVSPDLYASTRNMPCRQTYVDAANLCLGARTLFGSAYPTRAHADAVRDFMTMGWEPALVDRILYDNAADLLGL